ncbi:23S rRNA pseudouridine2605 synthase [Desulfatibacillum alkenivorans DSM 16219]|jgi:23S rRNA pseudouridine2605 synthase/23S rRNA pseudouridine2604 synthase|uniref:Pseudouridine synthase n=1 Tax=Desulfatibacillum alkenivorans DSM 16219 TaxID=1121393 RepID=A0A1M6LWY1_9BACT|nr:pseudouridine synthase [Desulfatibacillum alkenivorans]SHJ75671.1 23S rRNA pseudouridine2605 synthase [Desulfatibacillum alkenivorans DSM 16219]
MALERLQKYLAHAGVCSRRHAEELISQGKVAVNGEIVTQMGVKIDPDQDEIAVNGKKVEPKESRTYIMLNKPAGYLTTCKQPGRKIVLDLIDLPQRLFPIGRLDNNSTGLLLLTDDGRIHHRLSHPSFDHEKEYEVETVKDVPDQALDAMRRGMMLEGKKTRPAKVKRTGPKSFTIVLKEGRNRQIRKMVELTKNKVRRLHRVRMSTIRLGGLPSGKWRRLNAKEIQALTKGLD